MGLVSMMFTNEKRREIAASLRESRDYISGLPKVSLEQKSFDTFERILKCIDYEHGNIFDYLADLMDPDATTFTLDEDSKDGEEVYPTRWWKCARCGEETIMMYDEGEPVACPYCGAVVVTDDGK